VEVLAAHRAHERVRHGRHDPLVLPELGRHLVRARHIQPLCDELLGDLLLVAGVEIGVQQTHRHRVGVRR
jgi:hypothetical protein